MKIGMLTTWQIKCGIASYTADLVVELRDMPGLEIEVVPIEPGIQPEEHYTAQAEILNTCDLVHIQHEYSFWGGYIPGKNRFHTLRREIVKPVVLTAHTTGRIEHILAAPVTNPGAGIGARVRTGYRRARFKLLLPLLLRVPAYRRWIEVSHFASAREVIVHTEEAREEFVARGLSPGGVHLLPAGIPRTASAADRGEAFRTRHGLAGKRLISLFGFVSQFKGYELALAALPSLSPDVHFVIAGGARTQLEEPYAVELERRIREMGLDARVTITGYLSDAEIAEIMAATEIVIAPHTSATGSYSVTLPIAYGKPIIASDLACFRDIQAEVPSVRLHAAGDAESLANNLRELLRSRAEQARMSEDALVYATQRSWRGMAEKTVDVYRRALGESRNVPEVHSTT